MKEKYDNNLLIDLKNIKKLPINELMSKKPQNIDIWSDINLKITEVAIESSKKEIELKGKYAKHLIWILYGQVFLLNVVFFCTGRGWLKYNDYVFNLYIAGTLLEIFAVVRIIVKNIFNSNLYNMLEIILGHNKSKQKKEKTTTQEDE